MKTKIKEGKYVKKRMHTIQEEEKKEEYRGKKEENEDYKVDNEKTGSYN